MLFFEKKRFFIKTRRFTGGIFLGKKMFNENLYNESLLINKYYNLLFALKVKKSCSCFNCSIKSCK